MELTDIFFPTVGILVVFTLWKASFQRNQISNKKTAIKNSLSKIKGFTTTQQTIGTDGQTGLAIDDNAKKVCLVTHTEKTCCERIFSYHDLLSVELIENGEILTSTVRSSQLGGALIGGLAFGGIGAVIGGLSGKSKTSGTVEKITLRLTVNDTKNPLCEVRFLDSEAEMIPEVKKKDSRYQKSIQKARQWHSLIEVLIKRADIEDKENEKNNVSQNSSNSIADELKKLAELRDSGVLSDAEFQQQKEKLLG